jgi:general L-amino acid transport system permease protein
MSEDNSFKFNAGLGHKPMRSAGVRWFRHSQFRTLLYQAVALAVLCVLSVYLFRSASEKLAAQNIATGFGFLSQQAGFVISQTFIDYKPTDTYARAIAVGLINTLAVSAFGIVLATILGLVIGIARLSSNLLLAFLARLYVEAIRNVPLLLYLFLLYALVLQVLPAARNAWEIAPSVFLSNRGLALPKLSWALSNIWIAVLCGAGIVLALAVGVGMRKRHAEHGSQRPIWPFMLLALSVPAALVIPFLHPDLALEVPERGRFGIIGGAQFTPEFTALLIGLAVSTSAGIAEIVRSGLLSIDKGQFEAAQSLGLRRLQITRLILLPQALRVIVPPLTNSYLTLFKNSSLAVAIGYPDIVMVSNMTLTQTGQAIEIIGLLMLVYFGVSSGISVLMNRYNLSVARQR